MAASVSTLVVSWNDAAEMKLSVDSDALVIPSNSGSATAGLPRLADGPLVFIFETPLFDLIADQEIGVADFFDAHAAQHLADDHLDVLVVDAHALEPIDFLHFVDQIFGQRFLAENVQNIVRVRRAVHQSLAGTNPIPVMDADMLPLGNQIFARLAHFGTDHDFAFALGILAK